MDKYDIKILLCLAVGNFSGFVVKKRYYNDVMFVPEQLEIFLDLDKNDITEIKSCYDVNIVREAALEKLSELLSKI